ncbi:MAG: hypothetical protein E7320_04915 [Clostridiales bacterium]|nr:hypothetical protein [Clostridiales bacterium]
MYLADLHIHSRYSRATSRELDPQQLELWGRRKGLGLIGTGDLTHAAWRQELRTMLEPVGNGLYTLKEELRLPCRVPGSVQPRFVVTGEISTIYKKNGKTRKVHHVIILPGLEEADELSHKLEAIGNIHSDGRPILGLDSRDLLEIVLESCPEAIYIPAHIWTPHFSLFGAFSGFDTVEECYGDLSGHIHAMETGLSSDPAMNRCLSMLDGYQLVSSSDAHSPAKLGREATIIEGEPDYGLLKQAIETGEGLGGTVEFFPEEGKYHLDGHRACHCRLEPQETAALGGRCPVCGKRITVGVLSRVMQLADRREPVPQKPYESLIPLAELLAECMGATTASKKVESAYHELLSRLGPEMHILRTVPADEIAAAAGPVVAEAVRRLRKGQVHCEGGYDGEYGVIRVYDEGEAQAVGGQTSLLDALGLKPERKQAKQVALSSLAEAPRNTAEAKNAAKADKQTADGAGNAPSLNPQQEAAVRSEARTTAVIAGPGTGKTKTLVARIEYLIRDKGITPGEITAVTFTRQAAQEMQGRLEAALGKKAVKGLRVGTFHSIAMTVAPGRPIADRAQQLSLMAESLAVYGDALPPAAALEQLSLYKNGKAVQLSPAVMAEYSRRMAQAGLRDLDDVLLDALETDATRDKGFRCLLVDEFQDINAVQHRLVRHWSGEDGELFVIGDPDQSIYGFRGADASCFERLLAERPEASVITLEENYRSTGQVLECALSLIASNPGAPRCLRPHASGEPVRLMLGSDAYSEAAWIAGEIAAMVGGMDMLAAHRPSGNVEDPRAFSEFAVLARTHRQLEQIESSLRQAGIPCVVCGRERFWDNHTVQALLGFFRWLLDPADQLSLQAALHALWRLPDELITQVQAARQKTQGREGSFDTAAFAEKLVCFEVLAPFTEAVSELAPTLTTAKPRQLLARLAELTGCKGSPVEQLLNASVFHKKMELLLENLLTGSEGDLRRRSGQEKRSGAVSLMTLHGAKGLEFPVVFVAGLNEGDLPHSRDGVEGNMQEERRLLFVGITRAKEELILTCGGNPSPFLAELPETLRRGSMPRRQPKVHMEQLSIL